MRLFHYLYANLFGYFWMRCPRCGKMYGGHEVKGSILDEKYQGGGSRGRTTCCKPDEVGLGKPLGDLNVKWHYSGGIK